MNAADFVTLSMLGLVVLVLGLSVFAPPPDPMIPDVLDDDEAPVRY